MKVKITKIAGGTSGNIELPDSIFSIEPRLDLMTRVVNWQLAKRRLGTHQVKSRADINLTKSKAFKQKGTGRARRGANSVVQLRGGGVVHGPVQRSHQHSINRKVKSLGLKSALSSKMKDGKIVVFDKLDCNGKTAKLRNELKKLELENALIIHHQEASEKFTFAVNNIPNIDLLEEMGANVYDILRKDKLVLTVNSVKKLEERLK